MKQSGTKIIIPLPNGNKLCCDAGEFFEWGSAVRILDPEDNELIMWEKSEWEEDPELVMGAIFKAAYFGVLPSPQNEVR